MSLIPEGNRLFVIDIDYTAPFEEVQKVLAPHMDYVRACYASGVFLMSGPKEPRTGGIVIAQGTRAQIDGIIAGDPFTTAGVVATTITEFSASNMAEALKAL
ncbi:hypothetical protein KO516_07335 [Citreicella sp. C3M06]|uniref:YciI family protein n=1 Tax=Roseobacteraceae TaxID=2854170 RepID=UPI001C09BACC|nr:MULTISPECIES: YciI family protein [Roseobacteraceae]MBU2960630.1 hypothetical protein [Citreicella sp. C3M06]MDO6585967.1 YciI family protein [Salipiger sp. 1_MG-2023]